MEINKVIKGGYCVGCGACMSGLKSSGRSIFMNKLGFYEATTCEKEDFASDYVCPFTSSGPDETEIAKSLCGNGNKSHQEYIGTYLSLYAGHVTTGGFRQRGSSGGITSWLLAELLNSGRVDAIIHVKASKTNGLLYEYGVSKDIESLYSGAKSHYYPVEMSAVLRYILDHEGRYVVVGVPCFIKALRRLMLINPIFSKRILYCGGLFCGHLKGKGFAEMLASQCGVRPNELSEFDFRTKLPGRASSDYGVTATGVSDGLEYKKVKPVSQLVGTDWGMGFFKYKACDYCDDISAETADFSVGDAWLPKYKQDHRGTNILIVRNVVIQAIVDEGIAAGQLNLETIDVDEVIQSQRANVRHRKEDLPYRLKMADNTGNWRPRKRQSKGRFINKKRRHIQNSRMLFRDQIPSLWMKAIKGGNPSNFFKDIEPLIKNYEKIYSGNKTVRQVKRVVYSVLKKYGKFRA